MIDSENLGFFVPTQYDVKVKEKLQGLMVVHKVSITNVPSDGKINEIYAELKEWWYNSDYYIEYTYTEQGHTVQALKSVLERLGAGALSKAEVKSVETD